MEWLPAPGRAAGGLEALQRLDRWAGVARQADD
jgi:hypothetical protein